MLEGIIGRNKLVESDCGKSGVQEGSTTENQEPESPSSSGSPALYRYVHHLPLNILYGLPRHCVLLPHTFSIRKRSPVPNLALPLLCLSSLIILLPPEM